MTTAIHIRGYRYEEFENYPFCYESIYIEKQMVLNAYELWPHPVARAMVDYKVDRLGMVDLIGNGGDEETAMIPMTWDADCFIRGWEDELIFDFFKYELDDYSWGVLLESADFDFQEGA